MGGVGTRSRVAAAAAVALVGATPFLWVRATNFRGYDEWLIVSLLSRGIVSFPYANRPLNLLWALPAWALAPDRLSGFLVVHVAWLALSGALVFLLVRRIAPGNPALAFLAGAFTTVWAPSDPTRPASVQMIVYSGCTCGALLSAWLLAASICRNHLLICGSFSSPMLVFPAGTIDLPSHSAQPQPYPLGQSGPQPPASRPRSWLCT